MDKAIKAYQIFIDGLVRQKECMAARWVLGKGYPPTEGNREINRFLNSLSPEQKELFAGMLQTAREGGMHDTLAYMNEMIDLDGLILSQNGERYPHDRYESMHYDFACRCAGDPWPE